MGRNAKPTLDNRRICRIPASFELYYLPIMHLFGLFASNLKKNGEFFAPLTEGRST